MPLARSAVHVDSVLSNLAREYKFPDMIADQISPRVRVRKDSDLYYTFGREEQRLKEDGEGDLKPHCNPATSFDWAPTGQEPYVCRMRAIKDSVCDSTIRNADSPVRPVRRTIEKLTRNLMLHRERRVAKLMTTGAASTTTPAVKWDLATADIEDDVREAKELFRLSAGIYPTHIVMSAEVAGYVRLFLKAAAEISFMEKATIYRIPDELWGMKTVVSEATFNTAAEGISPDVMADIWPDTVSLIYVNPTMQPSLQDSSFSWTFQSMPFRVRRWRDEEIEATIYEVSQCVDEKVVAPFAIHTITDVIT